MRHQMLPMIITLLFLLCARLRGNCAHSTSSAGRTILLESGNELSFANKNPPLYEFHPMENAIPRQTFVRKWKSDPFAYHELIFAIRQRNIDQLERTLLDRSTPGSANYQQWLTYEDIGRLTRNVQSASAVRDWLRSQGIHTSWESNHKHYLKANATIGQWEELLDASFYAFEDVSKREHSQRNRALGSSSAAAAATVPVGGSSRADLSKNRVVSDTESSNDSSRSASRWIESNTHFDFSNSARNGDPRIHQTVKNTANSASLTSSSEDISPANDVGSNDGNRMGSKCDREILRTADVERMDESGHNFQRTVHNMVDHSDSSGVGKHAHTGLNDAFNGSNDMVTTSARKESITKRAFNARRRLRLRNSSSSPASSDGLSGKAVNSSGKPSSSPSFSSIVDVTPRNKGGNIAEQREQKGQGGGSVYNEASEIKLPKSSPKVIHRSRTYSIPAFLKGHITAVLNTVQTPPPYQPKYHTTDIPPPTFGSSRPAAAGSTDSGRSTSPPFRMDMSVKKINDISDPFRSVEFSYSSDSSDVERRKQQQRQPQPQPQEAPPLQNLHQEQVRGRISFPINTSSSSISASDRGGALEEEDAARERSADAGELDELLWSGLNRHIERRKGEATSAFLVDVKLRELRAVSIESTSHGGDADSAAEKMGKSDKSGRKTSENANKDNSDKDAEKIPLSTKPSADSKNKNKLASNGQTTVAFIQSNYNIGSSLYGNESMSQSVFETNDEYFSPDDLSLFQEYYGLTQQAALAPNGFSTAQCSINGADGDNCEEGNLDIQYIMGIAQRTASIYWYASDSGGDPFVAWITDVADTPNPPQSNSISWGAIEQTYSGSIMSLFNTEAMKLAAMGVTIMVATGDDGAPNSSVGNCLCDYESSSTSSAWTGSGSWDGVGYFPSFPATSPYVTAVGGTSGPQDGNPEIACQSTNGGVITTGGGFSTYFAQPSWQTEVVSEYLGSFSPGYAPRSGYNPRGRAYPDIAMIGADYQVVLGGYMVTVYGTSCATPVMAGYVSLINALRAADGLPSIGFINPTLYAVGQNASLAYALGAADAYSTNAAATATTLATGGREAGAEALGETAGTKFSNFDIYLGKFAGFGVSSISSVDSSVSGAVNEGGMEMHYSDSGVLQTSESVPSVYNDITSGDNKCCSTRSTQAVCCASGFVTTTGWDPVTGWGSIDFDKFAMIFGKKAPIYVPPIEDDDGPNLLDQLNAFEHTIEDSLTIIFPVVFGFLFVVVVGYLAYYYLFGWKDRLDNGSSDIVPLNGEVSSTFTGIYPESGPDSGSGDMFTHTSRSPGADSAADAAGSAGRRVSLETEMIGDGSPGGRAGGAAAGEHARKGSIFSFTGIAALMAPRTRRGPNQRDSRHKSTAGYGVLGHTSSHDPESVYSPFSTLSATTATATATATAAEFSRGGGLEQSPRSEVEGASATSSSVSVSSGGSVSASGSVSTPSSLQLQLDMDAEEDQERRLRMSMAALGTFASPDRATGYTFSPRNYLASTFFPSSFTEKNVKPEQQQHQQHQQQQQVEEKNLRSSLKKGKTVVSGSSGEEMGGKPKSGNNQPWNNYINVSVCEDDDDEGGGEGGLGRGSSEDKYGDNSIWLDDGGHTNSSLGSTTSTTVSADVCVDGNEVVCRPPALVVADPMAASEGEAEDGSMHTRSLIERRRLLKQQEQQQQQQKVRRAETAAGREGRGSPLAGFTSPRSYPVESALATQHYQEQEEREAEVVTGRESHENGHDAYRSSLTRIGSAGILKNTAGGDPVGNARTRRMGDGGRRSFRGSLKSVSFGDEKGSFLEQTREISARGEDYAIFEGWDDDRVDDDDKEGYDSDESVTLFGEHAPSLIQSIAALTPAPVASDAPSAADCGGGDGDGTVPAAKKREKETDGKEKRAWVRGSEADGKERRPEEGRVRGALSIDSGAGSMDGIDFGSRDDDADSVMSGHDDRPVSVSKISPNSSPNGSPNSWRPKIFGVDFGDSSSKRERSKGVVRQGERRGGMVAGEDSMGIGSVSSEGGRRIASSLRVADKSLDREDVSPQRRGGVRAVVKPAFFESADLEGL